MISSHVNQCVDTEDMDARDWWRDNREWEWGTNLSGPVCLTGFTLPCVTVIKNSLVHILLCASVMKERKTRSDGHLMETICKETQTGKSLCITRHWRPKGKMWLAWHEADSDECSYVQHRRLGFNILKAADVSDMFCGSDVFFIVFFIVFFDSILRLMR